MATTTGIELPLIDSRMWVIVSLEKSSTALDSLDVRAGTNTQSATVATANSGMREPKLKRQVRDVARTAVTTGRTVFPALPAAIVSPIADPVRFE